MMKGKIGWGLAALVVAAVALGTLLRPRPAPQSVPPPLAVAEPPRQQAAPVPTTDTAATNPLRREPSRSAPATPQPAAPNLRFTPTPGQTLAYRFDNQSEATLDLGALLPDGGSRGEASEIRMQGRGVVCLCFFPAGDAHWDVAAYLMDASLQVNDREPTYAAALEAPFTFRLEELGAVDGYRFARGVPEEVQRYIQQMLTQMQVILPRTPKLQWKTTEVDTVGRYWAEYQRAAAGGTERGIALTKRKTRYVSTAVAGTLPVGAAANTEVRLVHSEARVLLVPDGPWVETVEFAEQSAFAAGSSEWSRGETRFSAHREERDLNGAFPPTFDEFVALLDGDQYVQQSLYRTDPTLSAMVAGMDTDQVLDLYARLHAAADRESQQLSGRVLVNYLRQTPEACFEVVALLDSEDRFDRSTELEIWFLLTETGHAQAQQAVMDAAWGEGFSDLSRVRAVSYLHDFEHPEPFLIEELDRLFASIDPDQGVTQGELKSMALYALGSVGSRDKESATVQELAVEALNRHLDSSSDPRDQAVALAAVGNQGSTELIAATEPHFSSPHDKVRAAAFDALRRMEDTQAVDLLIERYRQETSAGVRVTALQTLAQMPAREDALDWGRDEVLRSQEAKGQVALVDLLGSTLEAHPENEDALRQLLASNPPREVKRRVYKYLQPQ